MKINHLFLSLLAPVWGACSSSSSSEPLQLLVGSYAPATAEGVQVYHFDPNTGECVYRSGYKGISNPSYLAVAPSGKRVYVVSEEVDSSAGVYALAFDSQKAALTPLNRQPANGAAPCYIAISPDERFVATANYMGGNISLIGLDAEGTLIGKITLIDFEGNGPDTLRQEQAHLHCISFTPDAKYLLANDLGSDCIHTFRLAGAADGCAEYVDCSTQRAVPVASGTGPRHLAFHPNGRFAYIIGELSGEVTAFSYEEERFTALQTIAADSVGARGSADIHLSPDGRFLYASNRLQADGIAIFRVDGETGLLTKAGYQPTGRHPRNFAIAPDGKFLLVACRDENRVEIYARDMESGLLHDTGHRIVMDKPVCLKFVNAR